MPQMAPIWWMTLFIMFIMSLMMIHTIMFFTFEKTPLYMNMNSCKMSGINWKW